MTLVAISSLSALRRTVIMRAGFMLAAFAVLCLFAESAAAQQPQQPNQGELDVTMQIIVDPDAKLPDEVVRRIPLPVRKPDAPSGAGAANSPGNSGNSDKGKPEGVGSGKGNDAANEAREHGKEASQAAKERAREAADQREQARRSEAEERRRERGPPDDRPDPPNRPPRN
jgi:hypothetical protein